MDEACNIRSDVHKSLDDGIGSDMTLREEKLNVDNSSTSLPANDNPNEHLEEVSQAIQDKLKDRKILDIEQVRATLEREMLIHMASELAKRGVIDPGVYNRVVEMLLVSA